jgi:hypothetical protein
MRLAERQHAPEKAKLASDHYRAHLAFFYQIKAYDKGSKTTINTNPRNHAASRPTGARALGNYRSLPCSPNFLFCNFDWSWGSLNFCISISLSHSAGSMGLLCAPEGRAAGRCHAHPTFFSVTLTGAGAPGISAFQSHLAMRHGRWGYCAPWKARLQIAAVLT